MNDHAAIIKGIRFKNIEGVAEKLKTLDLTPKNYGGLLHEAYSASPYKGRMIAKGFLRNSAKFSEKNNLLTAARQSKNPGLRIEVVKAFKESKNHTELITGLSLMTSKDASLFFKDYFDAGGSITNVASWLANISDIYIKKKRENNVELSYDGFFGRVWDAVRDAGKSIGEAINTVVDAVGKTVGKAVDAVVDAAEKTRIFFSEVIADVVKYSQKTINNIIEALVDAGREVAEIIVSSVENIGSQVASLKKVFRGIISAGKSVYDIMKSIYDKASNFVRLGVEVLVKIRCRIKKILTSAWNISANLLKDVVGFLKDMGKSVWYILKWAKDFTFDTLKTIFEKLIEIGTEVADLVAWCVRRSFDMMVRGFKVLLAIGKTIGELTKILITDPSNIFSKGLNALVELGGTINQFFEAAFELGKEFCERVYRSLKEIGMDLIFILKYAAERGFEAFKQIVVWLLKIGVKVFDILVWAIDTSVQVFGWVLEAVDAVFDTFTDIVEWVFSVGGDWMGKLAHWMAEKARTAVDWLKDKVILPLISIRKLQLVIQLASCNIVFLAIAYVVLKSVVDDSKTDYMNWPSTFEEFKRVYKGKIKDMGEVTDENKFVIVSDIHKESSDDIEAGIGHFYKNKGLFKKVLTHYSTNKAWTVVALGDSEEFWFNDDLDTESRQMNKIQPILNTNSDVYDILSEDFYKNNNPRRFVKIRGNHDDIWKESAAENKMRENGFPEMEICDYGLIKRGNTDILLMHGHQLDPYNCDGNSYFGKFISNFISESVDELNDIIVGIFGEKARIEGLPVAPFYKKREWEKELDKKSFKTLVKSFDFNENIIKDITEKYGCSVIIGHTHGPKILKDSRNDERYYINSGTCGWWEGCVWTVEIALDDIKLKAWTESDENEASYIFSLVGAAAY